MRDSKERLAKNNPESSEHIKSPNFVVRLPERNRSQNLKKQQQCVLHSKYETEADVPIEHLAPSIGVADRQHLQETILNLKVDMNNILNENTKLRSKIMVLEKQADKLRQVVDNRFEPHQKEPRELQRLCNNLKDRLKERNAEYQFLDGQLQNLKRSIKKTKINQMQIQNESNSGVNSDLLLELQKMAKMYLELMSYREKTEAEREEWKRAADALKQKSTYARMLEQEVTRLQKSEKEAFSELIEVKKKLETADQRRIQETNELKRLIKGMGTTKGEQSAQLAPLKMPELPSVRQKTEKKKTQESSFNNSSRVKAETMRRKETNSKEVKKKEEKSSSKYIPSKEPVSKAATVAIALTNVPAGKDKSLTQSIEQAKQPSKRVSEDEYIDDAFEDQGDSNPTNQNQTDSNQNNIFVKDNTEKTPDEDNYEEDGYESEGDVGQLQDIVEFIVYRLKGNRIARSKVDSLVANFNGKTIEDFAQFLQKEPFGIRSTEQNDAIISALSDSHTTGNIRTIRDRFLELLPPYELVPTDEESRIQRRLNKLVREYAVEINEVLTEYEDSRHRVPKSVLSNLLHQLGSTAIEIDYLLSKLCLRSSDIHHLNYRQLSELFTEEYFSYQPSDYDDDFEGEPAHQSVKKQQRDVEISEEEGSYEQL